MAYTARKLVTLAYYLSGVVSRHLQTVTGDQIADGIDLLNDLLAVKRVDKNMVPFFREYNFTAVVGQEKYNVPNMIEADTLTFNMQNVRFPSIEIKRDKYFGQSRVDGINALPFSWHQERVLDGTDIYLYFLPFQNYPIKVWGKFGFSVVDENTDLSLVYERNYLVYLRYALAEYICSNVGISLVPQAAEQLKNLEQMFVDISPPDLSLKKLSSLQKGGAMNWGYVNLGRGWEPF